MSAAAQSSQSPDSPPAAGAGAAGVSKSARKRNRNKNKGKADAMQAAGSSSGGAAGGAAAAHSHGGNGGGGGHSHGHDGHGHGGGGGHSHSHGGAPCGHGGEDDHGGSGGSSWIPPEDLSEAIHYCDVLFHFNSYSQHSFQRLERMHSDFQSIPSVLQSLVPGFEDRMTSLRKAVRANHAFLAEIVAHRDVFYNSEEIDYERLEQKVEQEHRINEERMSKVRSTLRQCVRDWSSEGAAERAACYGPILDELQRLYPDASTRSQVRVLVPGSGLGRLVWEVANLGFHALGNEFSYFMLLCSFLILNSCKETNIFEIFPYVHEAKNLYSPEDQLRSVRIPDVNPSVLPPGAQLSMAAGDWMDIFSDLPSDYIHGSFKRKLEKERKRQINFEQARKKWEAKKRAEAKAAVAAGGAGAGAAAAGAGAMFEEEPEEPVPDAVRGPAVSKGLFGEPETKPSNAATWDVFASCYFVDCANNILEFMRTIAYVLKPGGYWINFGPLLYHFSEIPGEISIDLSWAELRAAAPSFGFELLREELNQPSGYTGNDRSMLRSQYFCVSCTWRKVGPDLTTTAPMGQPRVSPLTEPKSVAWKSHINSNDSAWSCVAINAAAATTPAATTASSAAPSSSAASAPAAAAAAAAASFVAASPSPSTVLADLLCAAGARRVRESASLPSGVAIDVWQVSSTKLGQFLLQASANNALAMGKVVLEDVEMLALLRK